MSNFPQPVHGANQGGPASGNQRGPAITAGASHHASTPTPSNSGNATTANQPQGKKKRKNRKKRKNNQPNGAQQPSVQPAQQPKKAVPLKQDHGTSANRASSSSSSSNPRAPALPPAKRPFLPGIRRPIMAPEPVLPQEFPKFNDFPNEIQKQIFEWCFELFPEYPREMRKLKVGLALVSRKVREWVEPLIYESIILPCDFQWPPAAAERRLELYAKTFYSGAKPEKFYRKHVKRVYTQRGKDHSEFEVDLLSICDSLTDLECWSSPSDRLQTLLKTKSFPNLHTLCIDIDLFPKDENTFCCPIFQTVTHLDFTSKQPQLPSWESLSTLECLTHLRVYMLVETETALQAIEQTKSIAIEAKKHFPPNLECFVIIVPEELLWDMALMKPDTPLAVQALKFINDMRTGKFDKRIVLGCCGDISEFDEPDWDGEEINKIGSFLSIVAPLPSPTYPRVHMEEPDTWLDVRRVVRERTELLGKVE